MAGIGTAGTWQVAGDAEKSEGRKPKTERKPNPETRNARRRIRIKPQLVAPKQTKAEERSRRRAETALWRAVENTEVLTTKYTKLASQARHKMDAPKLGCSLTRIVVTKSRMGTGNLFLTFQNASPFVWFVYFVVY